MKFLVANPTSGLLLPPGMGKTASTLHAFQTLKDMGIVTTLLIVTKLRIAHNTWPREIAKWSTLDLSHVVVHGPKKLAALNSDSDVYLINNEAFKTFLAPKLGRWKRGKKVMLVIDESTAWKNARSKRFRSLRKHLNKFERRHILSGTPTPKSLMDFWAQIFILDGGEALGRFISHFRNRYFYPSGFKGYQWTLIEGADKDIYEKTKHLVLRFDLDRLHMPELVKIYEPVVQFPADVKSMYAEMEKEFIMEMEAGTIIAKNAGVATTKLRQISNGGLYYKENGKRKFEQLHYVKNEALADLVEEFNGEPCLVTYEYEHDLARIKELYPKAPNIGGGVSPKQTNVIIDQWNKGLIPILLVNAQSVAHGLNLQDSGRYVVFYSLTWNFEDYEQLIFRIWRSGQKRKVFVYHIIVEGSADEKILKSIANKNTRQKTFLSYFTEDNNLKKELPDLKTLNVKDKDLLVHYANLLIRHIEQNSNDKLPKFDAGDKHADYNFVFRFMQIIGAWNQEQHGEFLKDLYEDDSIAFNNLATAFNCTKAAILKIISAKEVKGEFVVSNHDFVNIWPINIGEPKMAFKKKAAAKSSKYAMEEGVEETGEEVEEVEEVATKPKRATKKKVAKKAAKTESEEGENFSKAKVLHGEGEPKMEVRREIQALVPKGKRGINYATLVGKVIEAELLKTDKAVARHLAKMKELGFITY